MNCKEVQKLFIPFIDDELSVKELDVFLEHMEKCQECREEYEVYYTMIMGMRYLDDSTKSSEWVNASEKLRFAQDYLFKYRVLRWEKIAILVILCIGSVILFQ